MEDNEYMYTEDEMNTGHIVADCDEVLVNISPKIVQLMHEDYEYYNQFFRLSEDFDYNKHYDVILSRPEYYIDQWLVRKDVYNNFSEKEVNEARERLQNEIIFKKDLYDELQPTNLGRSLSYTINTPLMNKLTIVTKTSDNNLKSKEKFLKTLFRGSMDKVDIFYLEPDEKKSDVINSLGYVTRIYEDEVSNISDIIKNCQNVTQTGIDIPSLGYNQDIDEGTILKAKEKKIDLNYFSYMGQSIK
ncbi:hypothetical protein CPT_Machias_115 [Staphylococcus phage Machias]|nr:hypothetical protein CPT_Machias_115 [Staphylococcus phage Machias]